MEVVHIWAALALVPGFLFGWSFSYDAEPVRPEPRRTAQFILCALVFMGWAGMIFGVFVAGSEDVAIRLPAAIVGMEFQGIAMAFGLLLIPAKKQFLKILPHAIAFLQRLSEANK